MSSYRNLSSFGGKIRQINVKLVREIIKTQKIREMYSSQFIADCSILRRVSPHREDFSSAVALIVER
jgi:hypothetical protein